MSFPGPDPEVPEVGELSLALFPLDHFLGRRRHRTEYRKNKNS
jgi:hypothetical protein